MAVRAPPPPLAGITVLEFSYTVTGPTAGLIFAELGAASLKSSRCRKATTPSGWGIWRRLLCGVQRLVVDLKRPDGRAAIHCLVRAADIVLENCGPGTMKRLGCGYDQLAALSLRLMYRRSRGLLQRAARQKRHISGRVEETGRRSLLCHVAAPTESASS
jgi:crotonobetainyl-CoA:carnitine CoA-transferase CaiB-like acyl-CoA transferase